MPEGVQYCPHCGAGTSSAHRFCPSCGEAFAPPGVVPPAPRKKGLWRWVLLIVAVVVVGCGALSLYSMLREGLSSSRAPPAVVVATATRRQVTAIATETSMAVLSPSPRALEFTTAPVTKTAQPTARPPTATPEPPTAQPTEAERVEAQVVRVVDGDTIDVSIDGVTYPLRYIGIDSPESGTPQGDRATEANRELVAGQTVYLETDVSDRDPYDRLLRYVYLADGTLVNARLVRQGFAVAKEYPPDTQLSQRLANAQVKAEEAGAGFWAPVATAIPPTPEPPKATATGEVSQPTQPPPPPPTASPAVCACGGNLYNCGDFGTHARAQACYEYCKSLGFGDVHQLDGDHDGSACETLP